MATRPPTRTLHSLHCRSGISPEPPRQAPMGHGPPHGVLARIPAPRTRISREMGDRYPTPANDHPAYRRPRQPQLRLGRRMRTPYHHHGQLPHNTTNSIRTAARGGRQSLRTIPSRVRRPPPRTKPPHHRTPPTNPAPPPTPVPHT